MPNCERFIEGIARINFIDPTALAIKRLLLLDILKVLDDEFKRLEQNVQNARTVVEDLAESNVLKEYKAEQEKEKERIQTLIVHTTEQIAQLQDYKLSEDINLVTVFGSYFRNLHHLANTLSDAPPEIKKLQTPLYVQILFKLSKAEREEQLKTLTSFNILDMLNEAIKTYDQQNDPQIQQIVHMAYFELLNRECEELSKLNEINYDQYLSFLKNLSEKLPDVGASNIIDNLSDYRSADGKNSISRLLLNLENKLPASLKNDWENDKKIETEKQRATVFHQLRYGQDNRREYINKRLEKMEHDLVWAREIRDLELFTDPKNSKTNEIVRSLAEHRFIQLHAKEYSLNTPVKSCGLLNVIGNVQIKNYDSIKTYIHDKDALILYNNSIYYADYKNKELNKLDPNHTQYNYIKSAIERQNVILDTISKSDKTDNLLIAALIGQEQNNPCDLIKLENVEAPPNYESIERQLQDNNALIMINDSIYFANKNTKQLKRIKPDQDRFAELKSKFEYSYTLADTNDLPRITSLIGYTPGIHKFTTALTNIKNLQTEPSAEDSSTEITTPTKFREGSRTPRKTPTASTSRESTPVDIPLLAIPARTPDASPRLTKKNQSPRSNLRVGKSTKQNTARAKHTEVTAIANELKKPVIELNKENGEITIHFFYYDDRAPQEIDDYVKAQGGYGRDMNIRLLKPQPKEDPLRGKITNSHICSVTGKSLADIKAKLTGSDYHDYCVQIIGKLESALKKDQTTEISQLEISNNQQLLLHKLIELFDLYQFNYFTESKIAIPSNLIAAFDEIKRGAYISALRIINVDVYVDQVYQYIGNLKKDTTNTKLHAFIDKAQRIARSTEKKKEIQESLANSLKAKINFNERVESVVKLFTDEYEEMKSTLLLSPTSIGRMKNDIRSMAEDISKLIERTELGLPVLTVTEKNSYFDVINTIVKAISPRKISDVYFKIRHSIKGETVIEFTSRNGDRFTKKIDLGSVALPYSLIKPPDSDDFIFSFGGTRGIVAPFEALDKNYTKAVEGKWRHFTNNRILGYGQYSSVIEVESLLTGLNQVIKKGYVKVGEDSLFDEQARLNPRTRPITAREDPLYRNEIVILQALSQAEEGENLSIGNGTQYWLSDDKDRPQGTLFSKDGTPQQYRILMERAKGDTYKDTAERQLKKYNKRDIEYHDPCSRSDSYFLDEFNDRLALSEAIIAKTQEYERLGFTHNDIKPENFFYKLNPEGRYDVKFIDWATGGFDREYQGDGVDAASIFKELFGIDCETNDGKTYADESNWHYVIDLGNNKFRYGINPRLQILHGARNGTLPYISPTVLGEDRDEECLDASEKPDLDLDTKFAAKDPTMDDWAITALNWGICNRHAYFSVVKGRNVTDYVIDGILRPDYEKPLGLAIENYEKFNEYFACEEDDVINDPNKLYQNKKAVMYIPSSGLEGEPLHLYRRLKRLIKMCDMTNREEQEIATEITTILTRIHKAASDGIGLTKDENQEYRTRAQTCIKNYTKLNSTGDSLATVRLEVLQKIFDKFADKEAVSTTELRIPYAKDLTPFYILCTYPNTENLRKTAIQIIEKALGNDGQDFSDNFLIANAPCKHLLKACIANNQEDILKCLLSNINERNKKDFIDLVREQGLLHYALQEGRTELANEFIASLKSAGAGDEDIFGLMIEKYDIERQQAHIQWTGNAFDIAIRNNNAKQLELILEQLPAGNDYNEIIQSALHFCSQLCNANLFTDIITAYNRKNPDSQISALSILNMISPSDGTSPYHQFLQDEKTNYVIDSKELQSVGEAAKKFLLDDPNPCLIAAKNNNIAGCNKLLQLARDIHLEPDDWQKLFGSTDSSGKNILNYLLENRSFDYVHDIFAQIKQNCTENSITIINKLLANIHPVNPLKNYLDNNRDNSKQKFTVFTEILDQICNDYHGASDEQQEARVIALIINKDWLDQQVNDPEQIQQVTELLRSDALSIPYKQLLFSLLTKDENNSAHQFYMNLFSEAESQEEVPVSFFNIRIPTILKAVATIHAEVYNIIGLHQLEMDQLRNNLADTHDKKIKQLETQKTINSGSISDKDKLLTKQTKRIEELDGELKNSNKKNIELENQIKELENNLTIAQKNNSELTSKLEKNDSLFLEEKDKLEHQIDEHCKSIESLTIEINEVKKSLETAQEQTPELKKEIDSLKNQLANQQNQIDELKVKQYAERNERILGLDKHIENFEKKRDAEFKDKHKPAYDATHEFITQLKSAKTQYIKDGNLRLFQESCFTAIKPAAIVLSKHRGCKQFLLDILNWTIGLMTLGLANLGARRLRLFKSPTDSAQKIEKLMNLIEPDREKRGELDKLMDGKDGHAKLNNKKT